MHLGLCAPSTVLRFRHTSDKHACHRFPTGILRTRLVELMLVTNEMQWPCTRMHQVLSYSSSVLVTRVQCLNIIMSMLHVICSYFARTGKIKSLIVYFWIKCAIVMYLSIYLSNCVAASTLDSVVIMQCNECEHCAFDSKSSYRLNFNVNGHYNTYVYIFIYDFAYAQQISKHNAK